MQQNNFQQRKSSILLKKDKSSIGDWDKKITPLCKRINKFPNYYTTSSCSGRIALINANSKQRQGNLLKTYHKKISLNELKKDLENLSKKYKQVKFKQEPCILHVCCKTLSDTENILNKSRISGFKRSGIISIKKNKIIVEILSTEKLELPIIRNNQILLNKNYLKILIQESNKNLEKTWKKIEKLEKFFD